MRAALFAALLLSLWSAAQAQRTKSVLPPIPDDYFLRDSTPLNVEPVTDEDNRYSDTIGPEGGQLITLDAAGNTYTLMVPKGALGFPEQLSMTPLSDLKGMPFKKGLNVGVQLEPEGTFFIKPVELEIAFAKPPDLNSITPFDYTGKGQDFTSTSLERKPGHFVFVLNHFSGVGFGNSTEAERVAELVRQPVRAEERINKLAQEQLQPLHNRAVQADALGQPIPEEDQDAAVEAMSRAIEAYKTEVLVPLHDAAIQSCTAGTLYIQTVLGLDRQIQLTGGGLDGAEAPANAKAAFADKPVPSIMTLVGVIMYGDKTTPDAPTPSAAAQTLMQRLLETPKKEADGQNERTIVEKVNLKCLDEEAQVCNRTGDLFRLVLWRVGAARSAALGFGRDSMNGATGQLKGQTKAEAENADPTAYLDKPYEAALKNCAHFELQLHSSLTQKGKSAVNVMMVAADGKTDYGAHLDAILPLEINSVGAFGLPGELPNGKDKLAYTAYHLNDVSHGDVALFKNDSGTQGTTSDCTTQGSGTTPGQLVATLVPMFKPDPDAHDDPDPSRDDPAPSMDGLSPLEKRDLIRKRAVRRILAHTPKVGLLAPPRVLDLEKTVLNIDVGQPAEHTQSNCKDQGGDRSTWLETWNDYWKKKGTKTGPVFINPSVSLGEATSAPGWSLNPWYDPTASAKAAPRTFPLKFSVDVPKHEDPGGGNSFDETWHIDITVVHTPQGSAP